MVAVSAATLSAHAGCNTGPAQRVEPDAAAAAAAPSLQAPSTRALELPPIPSLEVPHIGAAKKPIIDGVLDDPIWATAAHTGLFVDVSSGKLNHGLEIQGSAKLAWDDELLYVAFTVQDARVRGGFPRDAVDPHLWERDTIEIMIDPDGDGDNKDYYEIQINPQNLVFDTRFDSYNQPVDAKAGRFGHMDWRAKLESAVKIQGTIDDDADRDEGYVVEARIPFSSFDKAAHAPPRPGDTWRMNLYAMQDNGGVAWSAIARQGNFHKASRFGRVTFTKR